MKKLSALILVLSLFLSSCSQLSYVGFNSDFNRMPASEVNEINYYLAIDKFHYYINEYSNAMSGKIPDEAIETLREITTKEIIDFITDSKNKWTVIVSSKNDYWKQKCTRKIKMKDGKIIADTKQ